MLFVLVVDVLQKILEATNQLLDAPISIKFSISAIALQYADNTGLIAAANQGRLVVMGSSSEVHNKSNASRT
jgi:hypothetical protein